MCEPKEEPHTFPLKRWKLNVARETGVAIRVGSQLRRGVAPTQGSTVASVEGEREAVMAIAVPLGRGTRGGPFGWGLEVLLLGWRGEGPH